MDAVHRQTDTATAPAADGKVPAVAKAIAIVRFINAASPPGVSLNEVATALGITKSHCFNILRGLVREEWLSYDERRRTYRLSPHLVSDISSVFDRRARSTVIHEELDRLSQLTRTACVLTRVERDGSFTTVDRSEAAAELLFAAPIGHRFLPDAPAQMRVRLAWLPESERERALAAWEPKAYTPTTIVSKDELRVEIAETRKRGYGVSRAEFHPGVMTLAAPLFNAFGEVELILQLPGLHIQVEPNEDELSRALLATAARLNTVLGAPPQS